MLLDELLLLLLWPLLPLFVMLAPARKLQKMVADSGVVCSCMYWLAWYEPSYISCSCMMLMLLLPLLLLLRLLQKQSCDQSLNAVLAFARHVK